MSLTPGLVIAARYRVERRIGAGGMGEVWEAEHQTIGIRVALKRLLPETDHGPDVVTRFRREATLLGRLRSDHVVRVLDYIVDEQGGPLLVMEFIDGESLATIMRAKRLSIEEAVDLGIDVVSAVRDLHGARIVHRDLKPGNILLESLPDGRRRAVLVDLGVSRLLDVEGSEQERLTDITRTDIALGTIEYMAPEQITCSSKATPAADLYAVGALLYRAVTGRHVFGDLTGAPLARTKLVVDPPTLETGQRGPLAHGFEVVIGRALRRVPEERYASAEAMLAALVELRAFMRTAAGPPCPVEMLERPATSPTFASSRRTRTRRRGTSRHGLCFAGASASIVGALAAAAAVSAAVTSRASAPVAAVCIPSAAFATPVSPAMRGDTSKSAARDPRNAESTNVHAVPMIGDQPIREIDLDPPDAGSSKPRATTAPVTEHGDPHPRALSRDEARFWEDFPGHL